MMLRALVFALAAWLSMVNIALQADTPDKSKSPESIRTLVYLGAGGPLRLRLHLQIEGRPVDAVWSEAVDALFSYCDRNRSGLLETSEIAFFGESGNRQPQRDLNGEEEGRIEALRLNLGDRKTPVTRARFEESLRDAGLGPVSLAITQTQPNSQRLSTAILGRLDRNGDGKLSADELRSARSQLEYFDANEDELITVAELLGRAPMTTRRGIQRPASTADQSNPTNDLFLLPDETEAALKLLLENRGDSRNRVIRKGDFGGNNQTFAELDKNKDGKLDSAELSVWLKQPADLDIQFSVRRSLPPNQKVSPPLSASRKLKVEVPADGTFVAGCPSVRFGFVPFVADDWPTMGWKETEDRIRKQFVNATPIRKGDGQLEEFLKFMSPKLNNKPESSEIEKALAIITRLIRCRVGLSVRDEGAGLFEILDQNHDGHLTPRELVNAFHNLHPYSAADGQVSTESLSQRFLVDVTAGSIRVIGYTEKSTRPTIRPPAKNLPAWFTNMDRNGDGEISLREFLGPLELFHKLDKDNDGLISPEEARDVKVDK